jgi:hypothetical protein
MQKLMIKTLEDRFQKVGCQENKKPEDVKVIAHYFIGASDWYATEYYPKEKLMFGFARLNNDAIMAELGYFSLREFEEYNSKHPFQIERDAHWTECSLAEILNENNKRKGS